MAGTALVGVIGALSWRLVDRRTGLVALYGASVYPPLLLAGYSLDYEVLLALLVGAALLAGLRWSRQPQSWIWLIIAGLLSGLAVLCRETAGFVLVPIWILIWQNRPDRTKKRVLARLVVVTVCAGIVVAPWTIRNAADFHRFIPVSDGLGYTLAGTYNATAAKNLHNPDTMWVPPTKDPATEAKVRALGPSPDEPEVTSALLSSGERYISSHPTYVAEVVGWNVIHLFDLEGPRDSNWLAPYAPWPRRLIELSVFGFYVVAALACAGLATRRVRAIPKAVWAFPVFWSASVLLSVSDIQYRLVVEPFFVIAAAAAVATLTEHRGRRRTASSHKEMAERP